MESIRFLLDSYGIYSISVRFLLDCIRFYWILNGFLWILLVGFLLDSYWIVLGCYGFDEVTIGFSLILMDSNGFPMDSYWIPIDSIGSLLDFYWIPVDS